MAVLTAKASGKASTAATWTPEEAPSATSELVIPTGIEVKVESNLTCVSVETTGAVPKLLLTKALSLTGTKPVILAAGTTVVATGAGTFSLVAGAGVTQEMTTNGVDLVQVKLSGGSTTKFVLTEKLTVSAELILSKGILNTAGFEVSCGVFNAESAGTKEILFGASTIKCSTSGTTPAAFTVHPGALLNFNAGTSTIALTGNEGVMEAESGTLSTVTFTGEIARIKSAPTIGTLNFTLKGAKREVIFDQSATITVTTLTKSSGALEIKSSASGTAAKLKKSSGTLTVEEAKIKDSKAEGGATFVDINGEDLLGNTGWTFETVSPATAGYAMMV